MKLGFFISGRGSNLENIINSIKNKKLSAQILFVFSNKKNVKGLEMAEQNNIPIICLEKQKNCSIEERIVYDEKIYKLIKKYEIDYLCLAGFMHILGENFISKYPNKIINIHPSLLPSFKGAKAVEDAWNSCVKIAGCTLHFVVPEIDSGAIISQGAITTKACFNKEELASKILEAEHLTFLYGLKKLSKENQEKLEFLEREAFEKRILIN